MAEVRDPSPLQSKKFLAYLIAEISSKVLILAGLIVYWFHPESNAIWWWMITMTVSVVFLEIGAILGIAYVDRYVRVAQLALQKHLKAPEASPNQEKP